MRPVIWHNPGCGTSRNVLHILEAAGTDPQVVLYRETPPDRETLVRTIADSGLSVRDCLRRKGTPFADLGLDNPALTDDELLDAMLREPILINRPFVRTQTGVALCRPAEIVFDLIDAVLPGDLARTNGAPLVLDRRIGAMDPELVAALAAEKLLTSDLQASGARLFAFATPDGEHAGFGGLELLGADVLLRSVVVPADRRGQGLSGAIVPLLLRRAFDAGARTAWLLTETAAPAFAKLGFAPAERGAAPASVRATAQFSSLCPASATLMRKAIAL
ncbi:MAG: arsenate reductase (glutaredoxin) [Rhodobiaceae bacterium]|nr:arsenate reductase (glutaredoxin) [Rhodobiaceae bacterium]MCC0053831.1 arsenate reductase (glutaredoxin) [Rhodobiaceae bacterium]